MTRIPITSPVSLRIRRWRIGRGKSPLISLSIAAAFASLLQISAVQAVTVTTSQIFTGSKTNQLTRKMLPPFKTGVMTSSDSFGLFDLVLPQYEAQKFDAALGTLESVQITYSGRFTSGFDNRVQVLDFRCRDSGFLDSSCESSGLSGEFSVDYGVFSEIGSVDEVSTNRSVSFSNQNSAGLPNADLFAQTTLTGAADLAEYTGNDTFDLTAFFFPQLDASLRCDPNLGTLITACVAEYRGFYGANFQIALSYTYDDGQAPPAPSAIPLPAGAPLVLSAIAMLAWLRRRRSTRKT